MNIGSAIAATAPHVTAMPGSQPVAAPAARKKGTEQVCFCGCGGLTKSRFVPGHDARFHSTVKKAMRGEIAAADALAALPHDEAREEFLAFADKIQPVLEAQEAVREAKEAAKAAAKAAKQAAKDAAA